MRVVLTAAARRDLAAADSYSIRSFGAAHADRYMEGLEAAITSLAEMPLKGVLRVSRGRELRCLIHQAHLVFYLPLLDRVRIIRVLDARRDWSRWL